MKVTPTNQGSFKWLFAFFLAFCLFSVNSLQAQDYVSSNVAKQRLTTKANQLDNQLQQGTISQIDHTLNIKLVKSVLDEIEADDFVWNTELNSKISGVYGNALQAAQTDALQDHPQYANKINAIKGELDTLLQQ